MPAGVAKCGTSHGNFCTYSGLPSGSSIAMSSSQLLTSTMRATSTSPIFQCLMFSLAIVLSLPVQCVSSNGCRAGMPRIMSAAFSATITTAALVLPPTTRGNTDASTTRSPATPCTRKRGIDDGVRRPSPCGNCRPGDGPCMPCGARSQRAPHRLARRDLAELRPRGSARRRGAAMIRRDNSSPRSVGGRSSGSASRFGIDGRRDVRIRAREGDAAAAPRIEVHDAQREAVAERKGKRARDCVAPAERRSAGPDGRGPAPSERRRWPRTRCWRTGHDETARTRAGSRRRAVRHAAKSRRTRCCSSPSEYRRPRGHGSSRPPRASAAWPRCRARAALRRRRYRKA